MKKLLLGNLTSLLLIKGVDFFIPIFIFPLLINRLGIEKFGIISFAFAFAIYFSGVVQYGNNLTIVRAVAKHKENVKKINFCVSNTLVAISCSSIISILITLCLIQLPIFKEDGEVLFFGVLYVIFESYIPTWLFQGYQKMVPLGIVGVLSKLGLMLYLIFFLSPDDSPTVVMYAFMLTSLVTAISLLGYARFKKLITRFTPSYDGIYKFYKTGFHAFVTQFSPTLYSSSVVVLLGITANPAVVGVFVAAQKFVNISISFLLIVFNVIYPFLINKRYLEIKFSFLFAFASLCLVFITILFGHFFLGYVLDEKAEEISLLMTLLSPMILFFGLRISLGQLHFFLDSNEKAYSKILVLSSLVGLFLSLFIIPAFVELGAVFIMVLVNILIVLMVLYKRFFRTDKVIF